MLGPEATGEPDAETVAEIMTAYQNFHVAAGPAIRAGDALGPAAAGVRITGGPTAPVVTDGPFAEGAEVAGGYYVFEAENLDEALELARQIPACASGGVEVWPMVMWNPPTEPVRRRLARAAPGARGECARPQLRRSGSRGCASTPSSATRPRDHILGGAPLHPPTTATTVRVRDGKASFTDGPYVEGAEVANGFYLLRAADRDEAVKLASHDSGDDGGTAPAGRGLRAIATAE